MALKEPLRRVLRLDGDTDPVQLARVMKALNSTNRIRILWFLADKVASINEVAVALDLPTSTAALHIEMLEAADLIRTELEPASRGLRKVCARMYDQILLDFPVTEKPYDQAIELSMPIGAYIDCQVVPTCGLLSENGPIGFLDDPASFYEPAHVDAQLLWLTQGYVEYRFPNRLPSGTVPTALELSMEVCSEAPLYNLDWPSDITVWINGTEIGTWTCPADFGGERGRLTPEWWTPRNTQYGLMKLWSVNGHEAKVDGTRISGVTVAQLKLKESPFVSVRIGVKPDAEHVGGLNLFGRSFGNYPQDLVLRIVYGSTKLQGAE